MSYISNIWTWVPKGYCQKKLLRLFGLKNNEMAKRIFRNSAIDCRHFAVPPHHLLEGISQVNFPTLESIVSLNDKPQKIIEVSNLDVPQYGGYHLQNHWCPGVLKGLQLASQHSSNVLVVTLDINSCLSWRPNFSETNDIIAFSLFGDGIAIALVSKNYSDSPNMLDFFYLNTHRSDLVKFLNGKLYLSRELPEIILSLTEPCLNKLLSRNQLSMKDIEHWIIHPGGRKILDLLEKNFNMNLGLSRMIMKDYGNMGASSILFILKEVMRYNCCPGYGVIVTFGPTPNNQFTAAACLLRIPEMKKPESEG